MASERRGPVAGVVLAAGASTRMGGNKLLFEIDGEPLLRRAVRRAAEAGLDPVIVVLGHDADQAREALGDVPCRTVFNPDYARGVNTSLRAGIRAVPSDVQAVVVVLADMPLVSAPMVAAIVERYHASTAPLVVSEYGDVQAPPTLYDRSLFGELLRTEGQGCAKQVVRRHWEEAVRVASCHEALTDLDTPEDYERVKTLLAGPPKKSLCT
jgi:molybdenum cofactor cytidylyltransferase